MRSTIWHYTKLLLFGLLCSAGSVAVWVEYSASEPQFVLDNPKPCAVRHSR